ncbi:MAG: nicotinate (nicotinamide) nucleotide adenylyltransferase [Candidatus Omnitrophota bacterium]|nr:MAG: nicotinate (nicotinamide) nucleotide adenylyltransferase [Candidatus Omnitrophota bacterium]
MEMAKFESELKMEKIKRVGILGGTFNPPHIGHIILAQEVLDKLNLDKILFIPANIPPHKNASLIEAKHRLKMVKLSIEGNKNFSLLDCEIKRGGVSYTVDTLRELRKIFPSYEFYLIIGSDLAKDFNTWKDYQEIMKLAKVVVGKRKEFPLEDNNKFIPVDILEIGISSSLIRDWIKRGWCVRYLLLPKVFDYIVKRKLYL